ncbi:MAG TPA: MFS transporter [Gemmatales bacterium]|nr:MFS transporter [Gemmatales bacterium]HMP60952.1 MFS transporter [Gemmatales bacterium]
MTGNSRLKPAQWLLLLLLAGIQFTNVLDFVIMMPLGPLLQKEWHISPHEFGALVSIYGYAACLAGLLSTWFMDRLDRKRALLVLYAGFILGTFGCALASNLVTLLLARALVGLFGGILAGAVMAIIGDVFPFERRGFATGIVMSAFSLASILGVPLGLMVAETWSWRWPFAALATLSLGLLALCAWRLPSLRDHLGPRSPTPPWQATLELVADVNVRWGLAMLGLVVFTTFAVAPYLPIYLVGNVGMRGEHLKYVYLCGGLATLATLAPVGRLADRYGKRLVFRVAAVATVVPLLGLTHLPTVPLVVILTLTSVFMVISSARNVPLLALVTACTDARRRGSFMSLIGAVQHLSMAVASSLAGLILGVSEMSTQGASGSRDTRPLEHFALVGWGATMATLLSAWMVSKLRSVEASQVSEEHPTASAALAAVEPETSPCV